MRTVTVFAVVCVIASLCGSGAAYSIPPEAEAYIREHLFAPEVEHLGRISKDDTPRRPVVLMHGLGDSGSNPGMESLAKSISSAYPGTYAKAVDVCDGMESFFTLMPQQVAKFAEVVRADPNLKDGFNLVGLSQGGIIGRGYIEQFNDPPVYNFVSICGPQEGVGTCPAGTPGFICDIFNLGPYTAKLSFAGYWKNVDNEAQYLKESPYLADVSNERDSKNSTYFNNLVSLNKYVLIMALNDTVVQPKESAQHGFWAWGDKSHSDVVLMRDSPGYQGDFIGLKTLDAGNRIDSYNFTGEHIRFSSQFWAQVVLPYFNNYPNSTRDESDPVMMA